MTAEKLIYETDPKIYGFEPEYVGYYEQVNDLVIYDSYELNSDYNLIQSGLGDYKVFITIEVEKQEDLLEKYGIIADFAKGLDRSWVFASGHPLTKKNFSFLSPHVIPKDGTLPGWNSNFSSVDKFFKQGKPHATFKFRRLDHRVFQYNPLEMALKVQKHYFQASEAIKVLVDLHYHAHKTEDGYSTLFFLAKSLELVRALLPGKDDKEKEKNLPFNLSEHLKTSLHNLFNLSNNRFEVRHVVREPQTLSLHSKLTHEEIEIFKHDADLIIRSVVCSSLGVGVDFST